MAYQLNRRQALKRGGLLLAAPAGLGALLEACGSSNAGASSGSGKTPRHGGGLTFAISQDPVYLAPFGGIPTSNHWGNEFMYDSLLQWDKKLNPQPALASSYTTPDPTTYVFKLKSGIKFQNGQELTAADCVYSFDMMLNPPPPGSVSYLAQVPPIASVEAKDPHTLQINMKSPAASLIGFLAWERYSSIAPQNMYKELNPTLQGIGTGPFKLDQYVPNDHVSYTRWPQFWGAPLPYLQNLTLKVIPDEQAAVAALRSNAIQGTTVGADNAQILANDKNVSVLKTLTAAFYELQFTVKAGENKPWADKRVRQAINYAINRKDLINKVFSGEATYSSVIPSGYGKYPLSNSSLVDNYQKHDVAKAKQLMSAAGHGNGFQITMTTFATPATFVQMAQVIQQHLAAINIKLNIVPQATAEFAANNGTGSFDLDLTQRGMRGDPDGFVREYQSLKNSWFSGWNPPSNLYSLLDQGLQELNQSKRPPIYQEIQKVLLDELVEIPLVNAYNFQAVSSKLRGFYPSYTQFNTALRQSWLSGTA